MIEKTTDYGQINLSTDVIATICGGAATECYGVVGMASQKMIDGFYDFLKRDNYSKGIVVENGETGTIINLTLSLVMVLRFLKSFMKCRRKLSMLLKAHLTLM